MLKRISAIAGTSSRMKAWKAATLFKKRLWDRRLLVKFVKFLRTSILQTPLGDCL